MIKSPFNGTFWEKVINHIDHTFLTRIYPSQETVTVFQKILRSHRKCIVHPRQELILNILEKMASLQPCLPPSSFPVFSLHLSSLQSYWSCCCSLYNHTHSHLRTFAFAINLTQNTTRNTCSHSCLIFSTATFSKEPSLIIQTR